MVEGSFGLGCSLGFYLISQPDRNGNKQEVGIFPGGRDVTQRHTGSFAEVAEAATLGTTGSQ